MVNANDYTLYLSISQKQRKWFSTQFDNMPSGASRGQEIKQYLMNLLSVDNIKIVRIDLVFNNRDLIHYLELRGEAIKNQNWPLATKIEKRIESMKEKQYNSELIGAYIIYDRQQDLELSLHLYQKNMTVARTLFEHGIEIRNAENPENIKWKNIHFTIQEKLFRAFVVFVVLMCLAYASFWSQQQLLSLKNENDKYEYINCEA